MEDASQPNTLNGAPEFTELGKRIETIRIERGLSKQHLARYAGTSRQQLWRVMTGKCELTVGLKSRLAEALSVATLDLDPPSIRAAARTRSASNAPSPLSPPDITAYLRDARTIARTLATMPSGEAGRTLKRRLLDAIEDFALADGHALDSRFFDLRRKVLTEQL